MPLQKRSLRRPSPPTFEEKVELAGSHAEHQKYCIAPDQVISRYHSPHLFHGDLRHCILSPVPHSLRKRHGLRDLRQQLEKPTDSSPKLPPPPTRSPPTPPNRIQEKRPREPLRRSTISISKLSVRSNLPKPQKSLKSEHRARLPTPPPTHSWQSASGAGSGSVYYRAPRTSTKIASWKPRTSTASKNEAPVKAASVKRYTCEDPSKNLEDGVEYGKPVGLLKVVNGRASPDGSECSRALHPVSGLSINTDCVNINTGIKKTIARDDIFNTAANQNSRPKSTVHVPSCPSENQDPSSTTETILSKGEDVASSPSTTVSPLTRMSRIPWSPHGAKKKQTAVDDVGTEDHTDRRSDTADEDKRHKDSAIAQTIDESTLATATAHARDSAPDHTAKQHPSTRTRPARPNTDGARTITSEASFQTEVRAVTTAGPTVVISETKVPAAQEPTSISTSKNTSASEVQQHAHRLRCTCVPCRQTRHKRRKATLHLSERVEACRQIAVGIRDPADPLSFDRSVAYTAWLGLLKVYAEMDILVSLPLGAGHERQQEEEEKVAGGKQRYEVLEEERFRAFVTRFREREIVIESEREKWIELFGGIRKGEKAMRVGHAKMVNTRNKVVNTRNKVDVQD